jgi:hypothetical protein
VQESNKLPQVLSTQLQVDGQDTDEQSGMPATTAAVLDARRATFML